MLPCCLSQLRASMARSSSTARSDILPRNSLQGAAAAPSDSAPIHLPSTGGQEAACHAGAQLLHGRTDFLPKKLAPGRCCSPFGSGAHAPAQHWLPEKSRPPGRSAATRLNDPCCSRTARPRITKKKGALPRHALGSPTVPPPPGRHRSAAAYPATPISSLCPQCAKILCQCCGQTTRLHDCLTSAGSQGAATMDTWSCRTLYPACYTQAVPSPSFACAGVIRRSDTSVGLTSTACGRPSACHKPASPPSRCLLPRTVSASLYDRAADQRSAQTRQAAKVRSFVRVAAPGAFAAPATSPRARPPAPR